MLCIKQKALVEIECVSVSRGVVRVCLFLLLASVYIYASEYNKRLVYIVSDTSIPYWQIVSNGIKKSASKQGYDIEIYNSNNSLKQELQSTIKAINDKVDGIIISPTNSSACVSVLKFAKKANIPVVIVDVGTDGGEYVSYISSDNYNGAYQIGTILATKMKELNYQDGMVGIVGIPQTRQNAKDRTDGFLKALKEANIKSATIKQQVDFSLQETYNLTKEIIVENTNIKAIFLQGSDKYMGAMNAIKDTGNKDKILLATFDAEPQFIDMILQNEIVGSAMQQPYLMGIEAVNVMNKYLHDEIVCKQVELPVLGISTHNIRQQIPTINKNVFGNE